MIILLASLIIGTVNCMDHEAEVKLVNTSIKDLLFLTPHDVINIPAGHYRIIRLREMTNYMVINGERLDTQDLSHATLTWDGRNWIGTSE